VDLAIRPDAGRPVVDGRHSDLRLVAVPPQLREHIGFPPFASQHLDNSLRNLAELAEARV
jgi:hypothetical protein